MLLSLQIPELVLGDNAALGLPDHLQRLKIERPLIVTDQGLVRAGHAARLIESFGRDKAPTCFDATRENPTADCVDRATRIFIENACDGVVALGGGSVIDTAKLTAVTATHGGRASEYPDIPRDKLTLHRSAPCDLRSFLHKNASASAHCSHGT